MKLDEIIKRSYKNCHTKGLHSIVFEEDKSTGYLYRMFYTDKTHILWKNWQLGSNELSLALHSHHCDIKMHMVLGTLCNTIADITELKENESSSYNSIKGWNYQSKIKNERGFFSPVKTNFAWENIKVKSLNIGESLSMKAQEKHTVYVSANTEAAWIIEEGARDSNYNSRSYSNNNLMDFNFKEHYLPITKEEVKKMMPLIENWKKLKSKT